MSISNFIGRGGHWACGVALLAALVSGCGGGSGGGGAAPAPANIPPVTTMLLSGLVEAGGSGADVSANTGGELVLSGSSSADANGDALTYKWSITSKPATSTLALTADTSVKQTIVPDVAGNYVITLRVTDSKGAFSEKRVTILVRENAAPVTNVVITANYIGVATTSPTQSLSTGAAVVLDARGSKDADGDAVTTTWTLLEKPTASLAGLTIDGPVSRFVADLPGVYKVRARGADDRGAYSETVYVFNADNNAPQTLVVTSALSPNANSTIETNAGYIVSLDSYHSFDLGGTELTMSWSLVSKPAGSAAALTSASGKATQITPDVLGDYVVRMNATNTSGSISSFQTTISVKNRSPIAYVTNNAAPVAVQTGPSVRLPLNTSVQLRGGASVDADGDALTYDWALISRPAASATQLSSATESSVQMTADVSGAYVVTLRVTDPAGAYSEKTMTFQAGSFAPVAVIDKSFATVLLGGSAAASGAMSFDEDSNSLSYAWAIETAPAGSAAAIVSPGSADMSFTPDLAGSYALSLTVSDGTNVSTSYLNVRALTGFAANVELAFAPLEARYSKGLDKLVVLATNPNTVKIVDPFTAMVKTVVLPLSGKTLNLSPNGKLAAVLQEGMVSLVDVEAGTLLRTTKTETSHTEALVNDAGLIHLLGRINYNGSGGIAVIDGRSGTDLTTTLSTTSGNFYDAYRGIYSATKNRAFLYVPNSSSYITYVDINAASGKAGAAGSSSYTYEYTAGLYLSETEDLLFSTGGTFYHTDTMKTAGKLSLTGSMQSLSHSLQMDETLAMTYLPGTYPDYNSRSYQSSYKRYVGALFLPDTDLTLPLIAGQQSYGIQIYHSGSGRQIALVQTGTAVQNGAGARYYVMAR